MIKHGLQNQTMPGCSVGNKRSGLALSLAGDDDAVEAGRSRLSRLLDHPRGTRMPSVAIYGDSGMGKTMIMKKFRDEHPPSFSPVHGTLRTPVLAMEMASRRRTAVLRRTACPARSASEER